VVVVVDAMSAVLVVEDNDISRAYVRVALESEGFTVVEAASGQAALQALDAARPALVILDILLPDVDGLALLRRIRARPDGATLPVLAMTGFFSEAERAHVLQAGFIDLLVKPVPPVNLVATVRRILARP
jgi:DNA-binding response OmpR family regulator